VNSATAFIPAVVTARAHSVGRFRIGFGTRFFVALLIGLVWVVPAAWSPRLIAVMFLWDGLFLLLWLQDLLRLPKPGELELKRVWHSPPSLGVRSKVSVELHNFGRRPVFASVTDETSRALRREPPTVELTVPEGMSASADYEIFPAQRGDLRQLRGQEPLPAESGTSGPRHANVRVFGDRTDRYRIAGCVVAVDTWGNLITNIRAELFSGRPTDTARNPSPELHR
jgi:hypothetical protein